MAPLHRARPEWRPKSRLFLVLVGPGPGDPAGAKVIPRLASQLLLRQVRAPPGGALPDPGEFAHPLGLPGVAGEGRAGPFFPGPAGPPGEAPPGGRKASLVEVGALAFAEGDLSGPCGRARGFESLASALGEGGCLCKVFGSCKF